MTPPPIRTHDVEALRAALEGAGKLEDVRLAFFGRERSPASAGVLTVANEIELASDGRIALAVYDMDADPWSARSFRVRHAPCLAVFGPEGDTGVRFYGGLEGFGAAGVVETLRLAAGADPAAKRTRARLRALSRPRRLRLFVAHHDEVSPPIVRAVARVAVACPALLADVLNAPDFPALSRALGATALPTILLEGTPLPPTSDEPALASEILAASAA